MAVAMRWEPLLSIPLPVLNHSDFQRLLEKSKDNEPWRIAHSRVHLLHAVEAAVRTGRATGEGAVVHESFRALHTRGHVGCRHRQCLAETRAGDRKATGIFHCVALATDRGPTDLRVARAGLEAGLRAESGIGIGGVQTQPIALQVAELIGRQRLGQRVGSAPEVTAFPPVRQTVGVGVLRPVPVIDDEATGQELLARLTEGVRCRAQRQNDC